jgi:hypothetical protein
MMGQTNRGDTDWKTCVLGEDGEMTEFKPIVVLGSLNMDLVTVTPRMPVAGETMHGTSFQTHPGGKGLNQAIACQRLLPEKYKGKTYMK